MAEYIFWKVHILLLSSYVWLKASCLSVNDPRLRPGHLKPLGAENVKIPVDVAVAYPTPQDFFNQYVDKQKPLIIRGGARSYPAFKLWSNDYLLGLPGINTTYVDVEHVKKENRKLNSRPMTFKEFITRFKEENIYLVDVMPRLLRKDVLLPAPLRCSESASLLEDVGLWYSSGGTSSSLHGDDQDDIRCVIRGKHEYLLFNYQSNAKKVGIAQYLLHSPVDVDRVDLEKFPGLADVNYYTATLDAGDCLYTPYRWFHQIRTFGDSSGQCIAVNVWFNHEHDHKPQNCDIKPEDATVDKYELHVDKKRQQAKENGDEEEDNNEQEEAQEDLHELSNSQLESSKAYVRRFVKFLKKKKGDPGFTVEVFLRILKKSLIKRQTSKNVKVPSSFDDLVKHLAMLLDEDGNNFLTAAEFEGVFHLPEDSRLKVLHAFLRIDFYSRDLLEFMHHGGTEEEFEKFRKDRIEERKLTYAFKEEL